MTLTDLKNSWVDEPDYHKQIHESFCEKVNADAELKAHRDFIEANVFGMGERSFQWLWKLIVDELPNWFTFLEIGVHKGQILSLIRILADRSKKECDIAGITPMDGTGTGWIEDDYEGDIAKIHDHFELEHPALCQRLSFHSDAVSFGKRNGPYDCLYIDGDHSFEGALFDLTTYAPMIKSGGFLVVDDAACSTRQPFGYFQGIEPVCKALDEWLQSDIAKEYEFFGNVVHVMVYKRK